MYVHYTDIIHTPLILVARPAVHARLSALSGPWAFPFSSPASSPPPDLHGRLLGLFVILRCKYNCFQGVVQSPTAYNSTILPRLGRAV